MPYCVLVPTFRIPDLLSYDHMMYEPRSRALLSSRFHDVLRTPRRPLLCPPKFQRITRSTPFDFGSQISLPSWASPPLNLRLDSSLYLTAFTRWLRFAEPKTKFGLENADFPRARSQIPLSYSAENGCERTSPVRLADPKENQRSEIFFRVGYLRV
jgi:hypothetical protein